MLRKVLIVEDGLINRRLLHNILRREYEVLEAENGEVALTILRVSHREISAVILDIMMPVMDGFDVLKAMREDVDLAQIPVIIATGSSDVDNEVRALSMGANDYVTKPYNSALIQHCLRKNITLHETASLLSAFQRDKLTGLYTREAFFDNAQALIREKQPGYYAMACFDINNFKLINDQYGAATGDMILKNIGTTVRADMAEFHGIGCRMSADNFAALYPAQYTKIDFVGRLKEKGFLPMALRATTAFSVGRYVVNDLTLSASAIYDRAYIAKQSVKGRYDENVAYFDETMLDKLVHEQEITDEMDEALAKNQFEVWFQPQFNHATGAIIGAEALVRWRHPSKGLVPPGQFIQVFERNGFIYALDKYVWEASCRYLRRWIDEGRAPLPVSVNISRYDVFREDLIDVIDGLMKKYAIPVELLRLEITESAFAKSADQIIDVVKKLMQRGFTLEIDDFGSGYSSLNTLKDVPANVLKLDMRFLEDTKHSQRGGNILESVVRMAKWLDMTVIAEGVETVEQANFLKSIGCNYVQGYLYARPMPAADYEALAKNVGKEERLLKLETVENLDNNAFWDPKSMDTLIFNSYIGGACIYEYQNGKIEMLRANDKYARVIGSAGMTVEDALKLNWAEHLDAENAAAVISALQKSIQTGDEITDEFIFLNLPGCPRETYLRSTMRVIASTGDRYLVYCTNENMTAQRQAEKKEKKATEQLQVIMNNISGGVTASVVRDGRTRLLFANDQYFAQLGYTREQYEKEASPQLRMFFPDDIEWIMRDTAYISENRQPGKLEYRVRRRDGAVRWIQSNISVIDLPDVPEPVQLAVTNDITARRDAEEKERRASEQLQAIMDDAGSGITASVLNNGKIRFLLANDMYYEIVGYTRAQYAEEVDDIYRLIHPDDRAMVKQTAQETYAANASSAIEYRIHKRDGEERWVRAILSTTHFTGEDQPVQLCVFSDITLEKEAERELTETDGQIRFLNDAAHDLLAQTDSDKGIEDTLSKLLNYFGGNRAYAFEFDYENDQANNTYEICAKGVPREKDKLQRVPMETMSYWLHAFEDRNYIDIRDVDALGESRAEEKEVLQKQGIRSLVAVPLRRDGNLLGFIGIDDPSLHRQHVGRLQAMGDYIAVMLTRRDLTAKIASDHNALLKLMNDTPGGFVRMRMKAGGISAVPVFFNDGFRKLVRMTSGEIMGLYGENVLNGVHPEDLPAAKEAMSTALQTGEVRGAKYRLRRGENDYIWLLSDCRKTNDDAGNTYLNAYYADATAQIQMEETQKELLDNMPCGAALYELCGDQIRAVHINKRYWELVMREIPNPGGISILDSIEPGDREPLLGELRLAIQEKRDADCVIRIRYGKDAYRPFRVTGRLIPRENGKMSIYAAYTPIAEETNSYQRMLPVALSTVMGSSTDLAFVKDLSFRYICCSHTFAQYVGLENDSDVLGKTDEDFVSAEFAARYRDVEIEIIQTGKARLDYEEALPTNDGSIRYAKTSKYPLLNADGNVIGIYGVTRDVTEVRTALNRLTLLTDNIPGGIATYACSPDNIQITYFNDGFCRLFGVSREEYERMSAENPISFVYKEDLPALMAQVDALRRQGTPIDCLYRVRARGNGLKWISHRAVPVERYGDTVIVNAVLLDVTQMQEATERLRISEEEHRLAMQHSGNIICRYTVKDQSIAMSPENAMLFSLPEKMGDVPLAPVKLGLISPDTENAYIGFFEEIKRGEKSGAAVFRQRFKQDWIWMEAHFSTIFSAEGKPVSAVISFIDVTERLEKEAVYKKWQQSLREKAPESYTLFRCNLSKNASFDTEEGSLLNMRFEEGVHSFNDRTVEYVRQCVYEDDRAKYTELLNSDTMLASYYRGKRSESMEYREKLPEGGIRWLRISIDLVEYPNSKDVEAFLMYENIDEAKRVELQEREKAQTDPLTGVLNRNTFAERMNGIIQSADRSAMCALLMLDLDGFKLVNDSFGHEVGDQTLVEAAKKLRSIVRQGDLVGRMGGDEFFVCLRDIATLADIGRKAKQICNTLRKSFSVEVNMSASVGIAAYPGDGDDFEALYHKADIALYHVKATGKDNHAFYAEDMDGEKPRAGIGAEPAVSSQDELKRRMLIVEDNRLNRELLENMFKDSFIIDTADDGNSALIRLRRYGAGISVVLLDLIMPGMDGFAVLAKMRESPEMQSIPVIVVSGMDERETILRTIKCGASDFITKPVDVDLLRLRVMSAVSKAENERLRAQNSYLAVQGREVAKYRAILENDGTVLIEYDREKGAFTYDKALSQYLRGAYDERPLWQVLGDDDVASSEDIEDMRRLLRDVTGDLSRASGCMEVNLATPRGERRRFQFKVIRRTDEYQTGEKFILTLTEVKSA